MSVRVRTPIVASLALVLGFAVAQGTGVRWLGGIVLLAGAIWCALAWRAAAGQLVAALAILVYVVGFAVSHPLGVLIGAWPSVVLVAVVCGVLAWLMTGRRERG